MEIVKFPLKVRGRKPLSKKIRFEVLKRDMFKCRYCGKTAEETPLHVDHVIPVAGGGTNDIMNLVTACEPCNLGKKAIPLDDRTIASKARKQAEILHEQKEIIEMMAQWRAGLVDLAGQKADLLVKYWNDKMPGRSLVDSYRATVIKYLKKFRYEEVAEAMDTAASQYLEYGDDGKCTSESVEYALSKLPGILRTKRAIEEDPGLEALYYIRGIARKRCSNYFPEHDAMSLLKEAREADVPMDALKSIAIAATNWTRFAGEVRELINDQTESSEENQQQDECEAETPDEFNVHWSGVIGEDCWQAGEWNSEQIIKESSISEIKAAKLWICDTCGTKISKAEDALVLYDSEKDGSWWPLVVHTSGQPDCDHPAQSEVLAPLDKYLGADGMVEIASLIQCEDFSSNGVGEFFKRCFVPGYELARFHLKLAQHYDVIDCYLSTDCHWEWQIDRVLAWVGASGTPQPPPSGAPESRCKLIPKRDMAAFST